MPDPWTSSSATEPVEADDQGGRAPTEPAGPAPAGPTADQPGGAAPQADQPVAGAAPAPREDGAGPAAPDPAPDGATPPPADEAASPAAGAAPAVPASSDDVAVAPVSRADVEAGGGGGDDRDSVDAEDDDPEPAPRRERKKIEVDARVLLALLVVAALAAGAYAFGTYQAGKARPDGDAKAPGTTVFQTPKEFATLTDPETGVKLSVPNNWAQYSTKDLADKAIRLMVGIPNTGDTVVVRVSSYSSEITEANLADQKNVFDQLLAAEKIQIFVNESTKLGNLPALFYVYRFTDAATGTSGIHAHYFVFQGRKMVSLIFQALPEARYETLAPTFDKIANSLEIAPGPPPALLDSPVTTAPATGAPSAPAPTAPAAPTPPTTG